MMLQDFSIDFNFITKRDLQHNFPAPGDGLAVSLQGFIISFDRSPLTVCRGLVKLPTENKNDTYWAGGANIELKAWSFLAAGRYGSLTVDEKKFTTTFMFAHARSVDQHFLRFN